MPLTTCGTINTNLSGLISIIDPIIDSTEDYGILTVIQNPVFTDYLRLVKA